MEKLDVVACEVVAFCAVKFWKVDEPDTKRFVSEARTEVRLPMTPVLARKSVVEALSETNKFVEVALVEVEFCAVKFCRVVEEVKVC